jgi:hypothetical protein
MARRKITLPLDGNLTAGLWKSSQTDLFINPAKEDLFFQVEDEFRIPEQAQGRRLG